MRYDFPADYDSAPCYLVAINRSLIPIIAAQLRLLEARGSWSSATDYERGYNAIVGLEGCLMALCLDNLIEQNDRLYRMLDTALFGTGYTVVSTDPLVVTPGIPPQRTLGFSSYDSVLGRMDNLRQLLENALNGTVTTNYTELSGVREKLQAIIDALGSEDTNLADILAQLELVVGALA